MLAPNYEVCGLLVISYIFGSVNFGIVVGQVAKGIDIREHGSKNAGTSNAIRLLGTKLGLLVFVLDVLKGVVPVYMYGLRFGCLGNPYSTSSAQMWGWFGTVYFCMFGHMYPCFHDFRGGKGMATGLGGLVAMGRLNGVQALVGLVVFYCVRKLTKTAALGSLAGATVVVILSFTFTFVPTANPLWELPKQEFESLSARMSHMRPLLANLLSLLTLATFNHRENIQRLFRGQENTTATVKAE